MSRLFSEDVRGILEALLFVSGEPTPIEHLAKIVELTVEETEEILRTLQEEYNEQYRGWTLEEVAGGYRLVSRPIFASYIEKLLSSPKSSISKAALETLAVIAYRQPITRLEVEQIRGVKVESSLATLLGRGLIKEVGRKETIGRPILYGTTDEFLLHFGLRTLDELPNLDELLTKSSDLGNETLMLFGESTASHQRE